MANDNPYLMVHVEFVFVVFVSVLF